MFFLKILLAKDKELNRWCSLKKALQRRPENVEKYDQIAYSKKATNVALKKKLLPSLFAEETQKEPANDDQSVTEKSNNMQKDVVENSSEDRVEQPIAQAAQIKKKKKEAQKQQKSDNTPKDVVENCDTKDVVEQVTTKAAQTKKKKKNKKKAQKQQNGGDNADKTQIETNNSVKSVKEGKTKKRKRVDSELSNHKVGGKKGKKNNEIKISDSRLTAFGINPKKYKNKLKYGNKQKN